MRSDRRPDGPDHRVRDRRQVRRPGADVPGRHLHHPGAPRRAAGAVDTLRLRRGRPSGRAAAHGQAFFGRPAARRRASLPAGDRLARACAGTDASMRGVITLLLIGFSAAAWSQDKSESREMIGKVGTRSALLVLHATERADGSWQVAGEYVLLPTLARRFVEGERSPELGVTTLKEGSTPILFGRPGIGELRGTWRDGVFKGTRYGPGGQKREDFEFSDDFPSMDNYSAKVRCEAKEGRYQSTLNLSVEHGK